MYLPLFVIDSVETALETFMAELRRKNAVETNARHARVSEKRNGIFLTDAGTIMVSPSPAKKSRHIYIKVYVYIKDEYHP